jgi:hypothetical protein
MAEVEGRGGECELNRMLRIMLWLVLLSIPRQLWATDSCFECVLGIWDDPALSSNLGRIVVGQPKDVYVGIKFAEGFNETCGISFSVAGIRSELLVVGVEPIAPTIDLLQPIAAPADTSMGSHGVGGADWAWSQCLVGNQPLLRVTLLAFSDVTNVLLQVKRRYPPFPPDARTPVFAQCDNPQFTVTRVTGGYYILNWNGDPSVRVDGASWSMVKHLYR